MEREQLSFTRKWARQTKLLLWKSWLVSYRNRSGTLIQLLAPFFLILSLFILQLGFKARPDSGELFTPLRDPSTKYFTSIPNCFSPAGNCYTFTYTPSGDPDVERVVQMIRDNNDPPISAEKVKGFATADDMDAHLFNNYNSTQGAYIFRFNSTARAFDYVLQLNQTNAFLYNSEISHQEYIGAPMQYAVERAIFNFVTGGSMRYGVVHMPHPEIQSRSVIESQGPLWFFAAIMFNLVFGLGAIVTEKEMKLRSIMQIMGLYDSAYWVAWFVDLIVFTTISVLVLIISGCIFQFKFFLQNDFGLYFLLLWLFGLTMVSMTFLVSTFVRKATSSTLVGFCVFIIGFFMQLVGAIIFNTSGKGVRAIFSLFSPTILQIGLTNLGAFTSREDDTGLRWSDRNKEIQNLSFREAYLWLILDFFLYLLIALYLDNVLPNAYGTKRPWYYFVTPSYWTGKARPRTDLDDIDAKLYTQSDYDQMDDDVKAEKNAVKDGNVSNDTAVIINQLVKIYAASEEEGGCCSCCKAKPPPQVAVKGLSLTVKEDTLLCLLGPNGAGKTTTIHMLCGFHEATAGDATIFGRSIANNIKEVQSIMGVCPQFDILWNELTGEEHLELFAGLKCLDPAFIPSEVDRLLESVELHDVRKERSSGYSGGMKRRLSVAISLIGDPKIVFLDEPTTGMDPVSRRKVWDVIEASKKGKVIVLTTHSMEEADILGDKVAIMAKGQLQCVGSSLHLKQKFGAGYLVTVGSEPSKTSEVLDFFQSRIPGCELNGAIVSGYMSLTIPRESTAQLVPFFRELQERKSDLGIKDLQLGLTTLEEVFLTIAESSELKEIAVEISAEKEDPALSPSPPLKKKFEVEESPRSHQMDQIELGVKGSGNSTNADQEPMTPTQLNLAQFRALFGKTITLQRRQKKTIICQLVTPPLLIILMFLFQILADGLTTITDIPENAKGTIVPPFQLLPLPTGRSFDPRGSALVDSIRASGTELWYVGDSGVDVGSYTDRTGLLGKVTFPLPGNNVTTKFSSPSSYPSTISVYLNDRVFGFPIRFVPFASKAEMESQMYSRSREIPKVAGGYQFKQFDYVNNQVDFNVYYNFTISSGDELPFLINRITNAAAAGVATGSGGPYTNRMLGIKTFPTRKATIGRIDIVSLGASILIVLILQQLLPVFVTNIVAEKETKTMEVMNMMGLKMPIYWIVHYIFNYCLYLVVMIFMVIFGAILNFNFLRINEFGTYFVLYLIWGHTLIAMSFLISIVFTSSRSSLVTGYFYIIASAIFAQVLVNNIIGVVTTASSATVFGMSVVPPFALFRGQYYLSLMVRNGNTGIRMSNVNQPYVNLAAVYGFLAVEWLIMMILWAYLHQVIPSGWGVRKHPLWFLGFGKHNKSAEESMMTPRDNENLPADVLEAKRKVFSPEGENYGIRVLDLKKTYPGIDGNPPKTAVRGVSFGVPKNSCLGVLGHNGAGKTTTIHMLIGLFPASSGTAYIHGRNMEDSLDEIRTIMGVCPQHDVLWPTLTGREHLTFYGTLKGLKGVDLEQKVEVALKKVNLWKARNKPSSKYSGGMRRRLSVAIAVLGSPKVIYLDEPSTGLDPKSRKELWSVINSAKENASVILTTHSMEEADALCDEIMIMSHGEIKCIGLSADLKGRFGEGFKLSFQVGRGENDAPAHEFLMNLIPQAVLLNELAGTRNYEVPKESISLETVFREMETHKEELKITDWAITNTTLEEVFLKISMGDDKPKKRIQSDDYLVPIS
eukprot:TRINITY_DN2068_c0_g1_i1.p1 TRINITY_DN2068_c0_g1~~TRINITY_DN2068_c0_g1_i1.p1  ORF type:complete len:1746 (+),score=587.77 TRINITY_DN2068_c0_g1_i1:107-5344(+)